jgi:hypothetical protein
MSDDKPDAPEETNWEERKKEWDAKLASGQPLMGVSIDNPMKVFKGEEGELVIDTVTFGLAGFDRLGTLRVRITPAAVESLKWVFSNLEKIPDGRAEAVPTRPAN